MPTTTRQGGFAGILVVDDDGDMAQSMARLLEHSGHHAEIALDGYQAIDMARRLRPGYVLIDLGLPGLDGYQVASRIREELDGPKVLIAVTGYGNEEHRRRAMAAGFDQFFVKPIDQEALDTLLVW